MTPSDPSVPDSGRDELMERMRAYLAATPSGDGRTFHSGHPEVLISEALALLATVTRERDEAREQLGDFVSDLHENDPYHVIRGYLGLARGRAERAEAALAAARQQAIEECRATLQQWLSRGYASLHAGEMTAQEWRTASAIVQAAASQIAALSSEPKAS